MESRHARDGDEQADSNLLLNLVNEKLKRYVSVEDFEKDVGQAIDQRIRQARSTVKSVLFGAAVVLSVLAVDIYWTDSFARRAIASALGIEKTVDERVKADISKYFESNQFVSGTYASRTEPSFGDCSPITIGLPFQIDITKDHAEAFVYLSFPTAMTTYLVTAYVNNQGLNPLIVTPVAGNTLEPYVINYDLTKATSTGLGSPNPRKLIQDFWIRIEETPNYRAQGSLLPSTQSVSGPSAVVEPSLNGLPTSVGSGNPVGLDVSCVSRGQKVLVKMFVQVAGDLRLAGDAP